MKRFLIFIVIFSLATPALAQSKPWYKSKLFWVGVAVSGAAVAADFYSTRYMLNRCPGCIETNPFLGHRPNNRRLILVGMGLWAGYNVATWGIYKLASPTRPGEFSLIVPAEVAIGHGLAAKHNFDLAEHRK